MTDCQYFYRRFPRNSDAMEFKAKYAPYAERIEHYCDGRYWVVNVRITSDGLRRMQGNTQPTRWWAWWEWLPW